MIYIHSAANQMHIFGVFNPCAFKFVESPFLDQLQCLCEIDFISNYNAGVVGQLGEVNNIKFTFSLVFGIQYNQNKDHCA